MLLVYLVIRTKAAYVLDSALSCRVHIIVWNFGTCLLPVERLSLDAYYKKMLCLLLVLLQTSPTPLTSSPRGASVASLLDTAIILYKCSHVIILSVFYIGIHQEEAEVSPTSCPWNFVFIAELSVSVLGTERQMSKVRSFLALEECRG